MSIQDEICETDIADLGRPLFPPVSFANASLLQTTLFLRRSFPLRSAPRFVTETMKTPPSSILTTRRGSRCRAILLLALIAGALLPQSAHASMFHGETLDSIANAISWVVIIIAPIIGIVAFWLVHILPEKIAHKRKHPQTGAIQCLCLLSLAFGGLLWPIAWLWAYSKPVLYKMAYGTDVDESLGHHGEDEKEEKGGETKLSHPGGQS